MERFTITGEELWDRMERAVKKVAHRLPCPLWIAPGLVAVACLAAAAQAAEPGPAAPPVAVTTADPDVPPDRLRLLVRPLTRDELAAEATAWRDLLRDKVAEISRVQLAAKQEPSEPTAAAVTKLQAERTLLSDRLRTVLDEWERKGGDAREYRTYATAVGGLEMDVSNARATFEILRGWLVSEQGGIRWAWNVVRAVTILAAFWLLARILAGLAGRAAARIRGGSSLLKTFLVNFVRQATLAIGTIVALAALEVNISPLLALIGGAAFVVGLALQGTLSNFAQGLIILAYRPFDVGDTIEAGGVGGIVESMNMLSTTIRTGDNKVVIVPNGKIGGDTITNATASPTRRVDLVFGVGYGDDLDKARAVLERVVRGHPLVLAEPPPVIAVAALADSAVNFIVRPWTKTEDYWTVAWDLTRAVKQAFDQEAISIPFPQRDVHLHQA